MGVLGWWQGVGVFVASHKFGIYNRLNHFRESGKPMNHTRLVADKFTVDRCEIEIDGEDTLSLDIELDEDSAAPPGPGLTLGVQESGTAGRSLKVVWDHRVPTRAIAKSVSSAYFLSGRVRLATSKRVVPAKGKGSMESPVSVESPCQERVSEIVISNEPLAPVHKRRDR